MSNPFGPTVEDEKKETRMEVTNQSKIVTTLKGGAGYDAPWIVIHSDKVADALETLEDDKLKALLDRAKHVAEYFGGGQTSQQQQGGQGATPTRPANVPDDWSYRSGVSQKGKPYKGWFPPAGSTERPVFL